MSKNHHQFFSSNNNSSTRHSEASYDAFASNITDNSFNSPLFRLVAEILSPFEESVRSWIYNFHAYAGESRKDQQQRQSRLYTSQLQQQQRASFLIMQKNFLLESERTLIEQRTALRDLLYASKIAMSKGFVNAAVAEKIMKNLRERKLKPIEESLEKNAKDQKDFDEVIQELDEERAVEIRAVLDQQAANNERHHSSIHEWIFTCFCFSHWIAAACLFLALVINILVVILSNVVNNSNSLKTKSIGEDLLNEIVQVRTLAPAIGQMIVALITYIAFTRSRSPTISAGGLRNSHVAVCCASVSVFTVVCAFARSYRSSLLMLFNVGLLMILGTSEITTNTAKKLFKFAFIPSLVCIIAIYILRFSFARERATGSVNPNADHGHADGYHAFIEALSNLFPAREVVRPADLVLSSIANCAELFITTLLGCSMNIPELPPGANELGNFVKKAVLRFIRYRPVTAMILSAQHSSHAHTNESRRLRESVERLARVVDAANEHSSSNYNNNKNNADANSRQNVIESVADRGLNHLERLSTRASLQEQKEEFDSLKKDTWTLEANLVSHLDGHLGMLMESKTPEEQEKINAKKINDAKDIEWYELFSEKYLEALLMVKKHNNNNNDNDTRSQNHKEQQDEFCKKISNILDQKKIARMGGSTTPTSSRAKQTSTESSQQSISGQQQRQKQGQDDDDNENNMNNNPLDAFKNSALGSSGLKKNKTSNDENNNNKNRQQKQQQMQIQIGENSEYTTFLAGLVADGDIEAELLVKLTDAASALPEEDLTAAAAILANSPAVGLSAGGGDGSSAASGNNNNNDKRVSVAAAVPLNTNNKKASTGEIVESLQRLQIFHRALFNVGGPNNNHNNNMMMMNTMGGGAGGGQMAMMNPTSQFLFTQNSQQAFFGAAAGVGSATSGVYQYSSAASNAGSRRASMGSGGLPAAAGGGAPSFHTRAGPPRQSPSFATSGAGDGQFHANHNLQLSASSGTPSSHLSQKGRGLGLSSSRSRVLTSQNNDQQDMFRSGGGGGGSGGTTGSGNISSGGNSRRKLEHELQKISSAGGFSSAGDAYPEDDVPAALTQQQSQQKLFSTSSNRITNKSVNLNPQSVALRAYQENQSHAPLLSLEGGIDNDDFGGNNITGSPSKLRQQQQMKTGPFQQSSVVAPPANFSSTQHQYPNQSSTTGGAGIHGSVLLQKSQNPGGAGVFGSVSSASHRAGISSQNHTGGGGVVGGTLLRRTGMGTGGGGGVLGTGGSVIRTGGNDLSAMVIGVGSPNNNHRNSNHNNNNHDHDFGASESVTTGSMTNQHELSFRAPGSTNNHDLSTSAGGGLAASSQPPNRFGATQAQQNTNNNHIVATGSDTTGAQSQLPMFGTGSQSVEASNYPSPNNQ